MPFEFATATRIVFGVGSLSRLPSLIGALGCSRALVVTGSEPAQGAAVVGLLSEVGVEPTPWSTTGEPTTQLVRDGARLAREADCDVVIGVGGGSVLDAGKAIAALVANGGDPLDYLEVIGAGRALTEQSAPYVAIPTTAGTGAEVTKNAVLSSEEHGVKVSLRSDTMLPRLALVDPELTYTVPPDVTAATGLDALTQNVEPYVSNQCNPLTDTLCREGMRRAARSLKRAFESGQDTRAREDMSLASLFGGLALANAKLGAVHGLAGPLGGMFRAPHGALCACLLPEVMRANLRALRERDPEGELLARYDAVAQLLTGDLTARGDDGVRWVEALRDSLAIAPLSSYGVSKADVPVLVEKAAASSSLKGNPVALTLDELRGILEAAL